MKKGVFLDFITFLASQITWRLFYSAWWIKNWKFPERNCRCQNRVNASDCRKSGRYDGRCGGPISKRDPPKYVLYHPACPFCTV